jgi:hypothetical protein
MTSDLFEDIWNDTCVKPSVQNAVQHIVQAPIACEIWQTTVVPQEVKDLAPLLNVARSLTNATEATAPTMLSDLSSGLIRVGTLLAAARYSHNMAGSKVKQKEAVLALEEFPKWCAANNIKSTEAQRQAFVDMHGNGPEAQEEAYYGALVSHLDTMKTTFIMAISSVKSIVYGHRDSNSVTGSRV